jgi:hypothetical protein
LKVTKKYRYSSSSSREDSEDCDTLSDASTYFGALQTRLHRLHMEG